MTFVQMVVLLAVLGSSALAVYLAGRWTVPEGHVGVVRQIRGPAHGDPRFRRVTPYRARGIHAATLPAGRTTWLMPGFCTVEFVPWVRVPEGRIGLVTALEGSRRPAERPFGMPVECDDFQDGVAFLCGGGEQGRQVATLPGGASYRINTLLFEIETVPRTYVPPGTVGLVLAGAGLPLPPGRPFARYVACDDFQDGAAFLRGGGERGRQPAILPGGAHYDINRALFEVITTEDADMRNDETAARQLREIAIPPRHAGVVITSAGVEPGEGEPVGPRIEGHDGYRLPWVFLERGGRRGVQRETLPEDSVHPLNPWFAAVMPIPVRPLTVRWGHGACDLELPPIELVVEGGAPLRPRLAQTLRVPPEAAPGLVAEFGGLREADRDCLGGLLEDRLTIRRFAADVLGPIVAACFAEFAAGAAVPGPATGTAGVRARLESRIGEALRVWGVEAIRMDFAGFEAVRYGAAVPAGSFASFGQGLGLPAVDDDRVQDQYVDRDDDQ
ncbi:hypothetical protein C1I98_33350 [Spongiactinospora gelatinilytica]|uniref:Band 7 domain-containing protein n=1 Tax=Spongiactinospora gelatinilytica TaxID=2666298 RepID=A0A2W2FFT0_9ACTN|nr:hypothetical protein [Spongiactinospora gelatinilytica]PZG27465.1 hypothetical protein C1I98_33350 [Spongiactinospora gelatinilytica]